MDDYKRKQSEHATRIATERALMDSFGVTRSQARRMNNGMTAFARKVQEQNEAPRREGDAARPANPLQSPAPRPAPMAVVKDSKNEIRRGDLGRARVQPNAPGGGGGNQILPTTAVQAFTMDVDIANAQSITIPYISIADA